MCELQNESIRIAVKRPTCPFAMGSHFFRSPLAGESPGHPSPRTRGSFFVCRCEISPPLISLIESESYRESMKEEKRKLFGFKLLKKDRERAEKGREKGKEKANERESGSAKSRAKMEKQDEKRRKQAEAEEEKRKRQAEVKLMKTPDSELTPIERVEKKRLLKDNEERAKAAANQMYFA